MTDKILANLRPIKGSVYAGFYADLFFKIDEVLWAHGAFRELSDTPGTKTTKQSRPLLLSDASLRLDGRRPLELRPISISFPASASSALNGFASISHGLTHVEVGVAGPKEPTRGQAGGIRSEKATLSIEIVWASFANTSEKRRRAKGDRRLMEIAASLKNTFEPVIMTHLYPRSQIDIYVHVLMADGGVLAAAVNATTLALVHAGVALSSPVSSVALACLHDVPLLDPCAPEESDLPNITVACLAPKAPGGQARVTLVNLETRLSIERFEAMLKLAADACAVIRTELEAALRHVTTDLAKKLRRTGANTANDMNDDM